MIRTLVAFLGVGILLLIFQTKALGHIPGQPPFFKINDELTDYYPVQTDVPTEELVLPQDSAPRPFVVGEEIEFEIDASLLPFPEEVIRQITFEWNFGDGTTGDGLVHTHAYQRPQTYILTVTADFGEYNDMDIPREIQRMFIHVVPHEGYILPKADFRANGIAVDPEKEYIEADLSKEITLDASVSKSPNGKITEYLWDFGDGQTARGETVQTTYASNPYLATPILRVRDENGFISDVQITLKNTQFGSERTSKEINLPLIIALVVTINILLISSFVYLHKKRQKTTS